MMASTDRATSFLRPAASRPSLELSNHDYRSIRVAPGGRLHRDAQGRRTFVSPALRPGRLSRRGGKQASRTARLSALGRPLLELSGPPIATEALQIDFRRGDIAAVHFQSLAWRRALTTVLTAPGQRSLRYQAPPPHQCTEATIALPHQAPCCSKTFPVTRGKLGAGRGLWARIMIALSCAAACPASEHVCWHNSC